MSPENATKEPTKRSSASGKKAKGFTAEERAAMKERAKELKAASATRRTGKAPCWRRSPRCRNRIAPWPSGSTRSSRASAPDLSPKTWYGMPAYAKDGKIVCFFQSAQKFNTRYATLGFNDAANLDDGAMWPTAFALKELTAAEEAKIGALVKKAVS